MIRLAGGDAQTILIGPRLMARLEVEAPGVDLRFEAIGRDIISRMEQGEVDLCFATATTPLPPGVFSEELARDRLALVMRRGHPAANRAWTLADYAAWPHATVAFFADGVSEIDARLAAAGVERRIALTTPAFHGDRSPPSRRATSSPRSRRRSPAASPARSISSCARRRSTTPST